MRFPGTEDGVWKFLFSPTNSPKTKKYSTYIHFKLSKAANRHIWGPGTSKFSQKQTWPVYFAISIHVWIIENVGVNDLSHEGLSSGSGARSRSPEVVEGCHDLPLPLDLISVGSGDDNHTHRNHLFLSLNCLFSLPLDSTVVPFEEIKSFRGYIVSAIISLQQQEYFVTVTEMRVWFFLRSRLQDVCNAAGCETEVYPGVAFVT